MPSASTIDDLESQLLAARKEVQRFLDEYKTIDTPVSKGEVLAAPLAERVDLLLEKFHAPLSRVTSLVRKSPMFDDASFKAMQIAIRGIDSTLSPLKYEHWVPSEIADEEYDEKLGR